VQKAEKISGFMWQTKTALFRGLEMVTGSELQTAEQEVKSQWEGLLALAIMLRSRLKTEGTAKPWHARSTQVPSVVILGSNYEATNLCAALEAQGVNAEIAQTLEVAAALTQKDGVRLVLVDESFISGASTCWQLRQHRIIPVVLLGTSREEEGWDMAANVEADAYLRKQMSLAEQVARIKAMLRRY